jgi:hypothetical protein
MLKKLLSAWHHNACAAELLMNVLLLSFSLAVAANTHVFVLVIERTKGLGLVCYVASATYNETMAQRIADTNDLTLMYSCDSN